MVPSLPKRTIKAFSDTHGMQSVLRAIQGHLSDEQEAQYKALIESGGDVSVTAGVNCDLIPHEDL